MLGQQPNRSIWRFLDRLQILIEHLESLAGKEIAYSRDQLQEDVEYSTAVVDEAIDGDISSFQDSTRDVDKDHRQKTVTNKNANTEMNLSDMDLVNYGHENSETRMRDEIGHLEKYFNDSSKERETALRREEQLGNLIRAR